MMYDPILDTFRAVAECGSFTAAAEKIFISHTAVRKQINKLENELGVRLFQRSQRGLTLNSAGQVLYAEVLRLMKESDAVIRKVQDAYFASPQTIRIGTSSLYPCFAFMDLWDNIRTNLPQYSLKIVPFSDDRNYALHLGAEVDIIVGPYDAALSEDSLKFLKIGQYHFCLAVPRNNILASKKRLSFHDLKGQPLMIMQKGTSPLNDSIRGDIEENFPEISLVDISPHYDLTTFNTAAERNSILLSLECWDRVHPEIKSIPLKESYLMPYGLIYRDNASDDVADFTGQLKQWLK